MTTCVSGTVLGSLNAKPNTSVIPALQRLMQEEAEFQATLAIQYSHSLYEQKKNKNLNRTQPCPEEFTVTQFTK